VETVLVNRTILRRNAKSRGHRSSLRVQRGAVYRVSGRLAAYQKAVQSKTIVRRLVLRVVPCWKCSTTIFEIASRKFAVFEYFMSEHISDTPDDPNNDDENGHNGFLRSRGG
jgi:hypothetical protein